MAEEKKDAPPVEKKEDAPAPEPKKPAEEAPEDPQKIDYKAEHAKEKKAREDAEKKLAEQAFKGREEKRGKEKEIDLGEGETPVTTKDLDNLEARLFQRTQNELREGKILEIARALSQNDEDQVALLVETFKNRTFPAHLSLDEQLQESYAIIHGRKLAAKTLELTRALNSKESSSRTSPTSHHDSPIDEPKLSSAEATALKDAGLTWDGVRRVYKKLITGGKKTYFFDPKTRKRWTE